MLRKTRSLKAGVALILILSHSLEKILLWQL